MEGPGAEKLSSPSPLSEQVPCLITGRARLATVGLKEFMLMPPTKQRAIIDEPLQALEEEWNALLARVELEDPALAAKMIGLLIYVLRERAREMEEPGNDGNSNVMRDTGNEGLSLKDFAEKDQAKEAGLTIAMVAALRIYTSALFKFINPPFRHPDNSQGFKEPHPVAVTVWLISEGLKRLRGLKAGNNEIVKFWRGMKDLCLNEEFEQTGGTELQGMSTTRDQSVAAKYALSSMPLLFCVECKSFMQQGSDISWLSLYPHEKEILYPPLTYLRVTRKFRITDSEGFVVVVEPSIS